MNIDEALVAKLVESQFPQWKDLSIHSVARSGWDNRTFHLGKEFVVRFPSEEIYAAQVEKEQLWLPRLAPHLSVEIPKPVGMGKPALGYPWNWSIYQWIEGENATVHTIQDLCQFASDLAGFLLQFEKIDSTDGPKAGLHSFYRGANLSTYDAEVKQALKLLKGKIDVTIAAKIWEKGLESAWEGKPVWVHGDMSSGNLLVREGKLAAVIDFGQLCTGDPSCDLSIAWTLFEGKSREIFRNTLTFDDATWARARAWTLWKALITAAGLINPNNSESLRCWQIIEELF